MLLQLLAIELFLLDGHSLCIMKGKSIVSQLEVILNRIVRETRVMKQPYDNIRIASNHFLSFTTRILFKLFLTIESPCFSIEKCACKIEFLLILKSFARATMAQSLFKSIRAHS